LAISFPSAYIFSVVRVLKNSVTYASGLQTAITIVFIHPGFR